MDDRLLPFRTPNTVTVEREIGHQTVVVLKGLLRDQSAEVLSRLCDRFREGVFAKAGKADPKAAATR